MAENQAADLMSFCASEFQYFFSHLGNSIHTYKNTGKVPGSAFKASSHAHNAATAKADKPKTKRKPTAFNMFVKEKMEELKNAGVTLDGDKNNNGMFSLAVSSWKQLSDEAKADFTNKFKVHSFNPYLPDKATLTCNGCQLTHSSSLAAFLMGSASSSAQQLGTCLVCLANIFRALSAPALIGLNLALCLH